MRIRLGRWRRRGQPGEHSAATTRLGRAAPACSPLVKEQVTRLIVELGNQASAWREAALDAELAFRSWQTAAPAHRDEAAAVYLAALEREERAASEYRKAAEACSIAVP